MEILNQEMEIFLLSP